MTPKEVERLIDLIDQRVADLGEMDELCQLVMMLVGEFIMAGVLAGRQVFH